MSEKVTGATMLFTDSEGHVLLFLRDDIPQIKYPGMWNCLGGHVEPNETPEQCIVREMQEELGVTVDDPVLYRAVRYPDRMDYIFTQPLDMSEEELNRQLTEGQRVQWFSELEVLKTEIAFDFSEMLERFMKDRRS